MTWINAIYCLSLVLTIKQNAMKTKIKGSITVEFEMIVDTLSVSETANYMKRQLESHLTEEWQISRCNPDMSTFRYKEVKN